MAAEGKWNRDKLSSCSSARVSESETGCHHDFEKYWDSLLSLNYCYLMINKTEFDAGIGTLK